MSGARFYFLTGVGALLQLGLLQLGLWQAVEAGFTPMIPPVLVKPESMEGTGFLGAHAARSTTCPPTTSTWSARARCRWRRTTRTRS